jgi:aspartyl protease family protein
MRLQKLIFFILLCSFCTALFCTSTALAQDIKLIALFKDKAMIYLDGKRVLLHKNKKNRHHILLLSADTEQAVMRYDGKEVIYKLNMLISTSYNKKTQAELILWANNKNMFTTNGKINGQNVNFLVDTGATAIAMSESQAKRLGIAYKSAQKGLAQTAASIVNTWQINLKTVQIGDIKLRNVGAIIIQGNQNSHILLGMTFLSKVNMTRSGDKMHLLQKY